MSSPLLQINHLQVDFVTEVDRFTAVRDVSFNVQRGETVALVGESGSGKSVTALSVLQLLPSKTARYPQGEILFAPENELPVNTLTLSTDELRSVRGNRIAMIFQEPMTSLNPVFTCGNQVQEAIRQHRKISGREAAEQTLSLFEQVKLPNPSQLFHRYPHQLSGGQKQRVMIAIAMSCHPSLLICDEPTTALDVTVQKTILQLIKELQQTMQMGVIFITHDLGVVAEIADRAVVMYKGSVAEQGTIKDIFSHPQHPYTKGLLSCRPALHRKGERLPVVTDFLELKSEVRSMKSEENFVGLRHQTSDIRPQTSTLMQVRNLSVWFPATKSFWGTPKEYVKAVDDVSFEVYRGETLGLVGESGCGKTTLGRALLRLTEPTSGSIIYDGTDLTAKKRDELKELRKEIPVVFQDPYSSLNPKLTIGPAIAEALKVHHAGGSRNQRREQVTSLLEKVNLSASHYYRYPHEFSGGQRQRIVIARALVLNPSFVICDESVSALDVSVQAQVLNLLNDLKKEYGFTVIFISHDLSVVRYISDRIMVMK